MMNNPVSTYRLQFHKDFTFDDLDRIIPYLKKLGIGTVYASPVFEAMPGSVHGYDGLNPHKINPEIGTEEQLLAISARLAEDGIQWLQDIVPNHMAFDPHNSWLQDVLEKGQKSIYASFFDVPWTGKLYNGKIMLPFLGKPLHEVIEDGDLTLAFDGSRFVLTCFGGAYPISLHSYFLILDAGESEPADAVKQLVEQVREIQKTDEPHAYHEQIHEFQMQLAGLMKNDLVKSYIESCLKQVNKDLSIVQTIAHDQVYRLCEWQRTDHQINFRRFFTVNGLICLNMQNQNVFDHFHTYIKQLVDKGIFQGLRIDHIDGLFDPTGYLENLRKLTGDETYIIVEKILEQGEEMPGFWPIQGSTGYDFLSYVNNVFTNKKSEEQFNRFYQNLVNDDRPVQAQIHKKKSYILHEHMGGELANLHLLFADLNLVDEERMNTVKPESLKKAISELLIYCPVYRYYGNKLPLDETEANNVLSILNAIRENKPELATAADLLEDVLLQKAHTQDEDYKSRALRFYQRCMQFTGPLMAKGVEDTLMYTYNRFTGHNEVGDAPEAFGDTPEEFHRKMIERQNKGPLSLNGTSTHDTKRGEDVRARLNVLTDMPDDWFASVEEWQRLNADVKQNGSPDANDEYLVYQTLIGAYPMPGQDADSFSSRVTEYLQKALREAKTHSDWAAPGEEYEAAAKNFAAQLLDTGRPFWKSFEKLHRVVADFGIINSLAQVLLKFTCPGVPDLYQGTELWDLSLVDPDNRRPVDYKIRQQLIDELKAQTNAETQSLLSHLWDNRYNGKIKMWLVHTLLHERSVNKGPFSNGEYVPLEIAGENKDHIIAFARVYQGLWYVVAAPLHLASLCREQSCEVLCIDWKDTTIVLPSAAPGAVEHLFSKQPVSSQKGIAVKEIFKSLPLAVLKLQ